MLAQLSFGPNYLRTNNALERYNIHIKDTFTFNQLLRINNFLHNETTWIRRESKRHSDFHLDSPIEHILDKSSKEAIMHIMHVWREGQRTN